MCRRNGWTGIIAEMPILPSTRSINNDKLCARRRSSIASLSQKVFYMAGWLFFTELASLPRISLILLASSPGFALKPWKCYHQASRIFLDFQNHRLLHRSLCGATVDRGIASRGCEPFLFRSTRRLVGMVTIALDRLAVRQDA